VNLLLTYFRYDSTDLLLPEVRLLGVLCAKSENFEEKKDSMSKSIIIPNVWIEQGNLCQELIYRKLVSHV